VSAPVQVGPSPSGGGPTSSLTGNEMRVLRCAANGQTYAAIAQSLGYQEKSVSKMALRLARKLGASNITHAVFLACRAGILDPSRRHGDHAGFAAHRYYGEEPCAACWEGERAYRRQRRAARKANAA
jgi:DNA-binding CsgD family transcriptional regulator